MENKEISILIIDDDPVYRKLSSSILQERFNVFVADRPSTAFCTLKREAIKYVICDYRLPEMDGLEVLSIIKKEYPEIEVIMISDSGDMNTVIGALRNGAVDYFKKPFTPAELWMSIERTQKIAKITNELKSEQKKNSQLKQIVNKEIGVEIIGSSKEIKEIKTQMRMVAETPDTSVLILGESGTGKELVARGIHNLSNRNSEIFGAVNMSAIPESLFESEFFGHKKGSFTGAITDKSGWFETTNKGTLFLDEIGEMEHGLQVKLLRVLEERTFTKVGTQHPQKFDVRIISATNKSISEISIGKSFRLDLFHRIGTFIINLPPLRERKGDIAELIDFYLNYYSQKMARKINSIHPDTLQLLQDYNFPGNVRELRNIIERAVIICSGSELLPQHFSVLSGFMNQSTTKQDKEVFDLELIEQQTILKALKKTNNNKSEAAKLLNIEWNALHRRIRKIEMKN